MTAFSFHRLKACAWGTGFLGVVAGLHAQTTLPAAAVGQSYSYQVTTTPPAPAGTLYAATGLPVGISINSSSGLISGTPGTSGLYSGLIQLTSGGNTNNLSYQLTVNAASGTPVITSSASASATVGQAFSYTVTASNSPTSFNVGSLPAGLSFSSPQITGTPTSSGTFTVNLSANNGSGQGAAFSLTLTVNPAGPVPTITSSTSQSTAANVAFTYSISATNAPTSFSASGLPLGLSLNSTTGVISGTPSVAGVYAVTLGAANGYGSGPTASLSLVVGAFSVITSPTTLNATVNQSVAFTVAASNSPISFNISGLPAGLSANPSTGMVSGTPTVAGTFPIAASANNSLGTGPGATITLTVAAGGGGSPSNPGRLVNLSILSNIQGSLSMGFVVGGSGTSGSEPLLIRAVGPSIGTGTAFNVPGVINDPALKLVRQSDSATLGTNSGWVANAAAVMAADNATGAFPLTNTASADSAIVMSLPSVAGGYGAQVSGKSGDNGFALTEVYDNTPIYTTTSPRLVNLSCLTTIAPAGSLNIGFVLGGATTKTLLIRASGPSIAVAPFTIPGTMADPQLVVTAASTPSTVLAHNAGWAGDATIASTASSLGAFPFTSATSKDSAVLLTLSPVTQGYSVTVSSATGTGGTVLVEIYDVP